MDVSMPEMGGIEATRHIKELHSETHVLVLTVHEDIGLVREAIHAGAAGYIPKRAVKTEVINAIHTVMRGDLYVHPAMMRALLTDAPKPADQPPPQAEELTPREIDVLRLVVKGYVTRLPTLLSTCVVGITAATDGQLNLHSRVGCPPPPARHKLTPPPPTPAWGRGRPGGVAGGRVIKSFLTSERRNRLYQ
jgi:two-component system response regulator NreC